MSDDRVLLVLALLIPLTHCVLGVLCLVSTRVSPRAFWLGVEFISVAVLNGLMWLFVLRPHFFRTVIDILCEDRYERGLYIGVMAFLQLMCYVLISIGLARVFADIRRQTDGSAEFAFRFRQEDSGPRSGRFQQEGSHDVQS
jgi:hypothetical protein